MKVGLALDESRTAYDGIDFSCDSMRHGLGYASQILDCQIGQGVFSMPGRPGSTRAHLQDRFSKARHEVSGQAVRRGITIFYTIT